MHKPYKRLYRPIINGKVEDYLYISDNRNCSERKKLIRFYKIFEKELRTIFEYVEPDLAEKGNRKTYSLKIYQLFCSVCMEVENNFQGFMKENKYTHSSRNLNMYDYFKVNKMLKLHLFSVTFNTANYNKEYKPFEKWNGSDYKKLEWYQAYNQCKHNRVQNFQEANLDNLIQSLAGLFILLYAQFDDYPIEFDSCISYRLSENSIFSIEKKPQFKHEEKYDFDWIKLKDDRNPYQTIDFEK